MDEYNNDNKNTLDFSDVDSLKKCEDLMEKGELFKILLFPAEFGGKDIPNNICYVPAGIPEIKDKLTETLIDFVEKGLINKLNVELEYKGKSFIPSKIKMFTSKSDKPGEFNPVINVW